jgi:hypothetical protein
MNERINELFGQALDESVPETWTTLNPAQLSKLKAKFAELIVRECVLISRTSSDGFGAGKRMEEHFGVE